MKTYNNGPRKRMMYGGMAKNKPMMNGGMATKKKPRKKAYGGGMMTATQPQQNMMQSQMMQKPMMKMAGGGKTMVEVNGKMVPDYAADGKGANDLRKNMANGGRTVSDQDMKLLNASISELSNAQLTKLINAASTSASDKEKARKVKKLLGLGRQDKGE